jgi:hypothetical protein
LSGSSLGGAALTCAGGRHHAEFKNEPERHTARGRLSSCNSVGSTAASALSRGSDGTNNSEEGTMGPPAAPSRCRVDRWRSPQPPVRLGWGGIHCIQGKGASFIVHFSRQRGGYGIIPGFTRRKQRRRRKALSRGSNGTTTAEEVRRGHLRRLCMTAPTLLFPFPPKAQLGPLMWWHRTAPAGRQLMCARHI